MQELLITRNSSKLYIKFSIDFYCFSNADCKVFIDNEEFNCHLIVLQCYSELFDEYAAVKKVELASVSYIIQLNKTILK